MKKIILILFMFILVFLIYYLNLDKKVYVLSIGDYILMDNRYNSNIDKYLGKKKEDNVIYYNEGDYRIIDLINDINDNKEFIYNNKSYTLDNTLIKADIIIISIGMNDLMYNKKNNYDYVDEVFNDLCKLFDLIRKYSKEKIFIFNYYNLDSDFNNYLNNKLNKISNRYDIVNIELNNLEKIFK